MSRRRQPNERILVREYYQEELEHEIEMAQAFEERMNFLAEIREDLEGARFSISEAMAADSLMVVLTEAARRAAFFSVLNRYRQRRFLGGLPY